MKVTEQVPAERVQEEELKTPAHPGALLLTTMKSTLPVGVTFEPEEVSVTVAVQVVDCDEATELGVQETTVAVVR